ncbi:MAG: 50S ribosomal protein L11 methyltransferase [Azospirillaceae bacterium]
MAVDVPAKAMSIFEAGLSELFTSVSTFEVEEGRFWTVEIFLPQPPDEDGIADHVAILAAAAGIPAPPLRVEVLPPTDWLKASFEAFPAFSVGRFRIHGSHLEQGAPGQIDLVIDAATAFGSGEHPTTAGCLLALDRLSRRQHRPGVLDVGSGTGILAFAAAKLWGVQVLASDIDGESVRVARINARVNGVADRVRVVLADGYRHPAVAGGAPYDLIVANILARPLVTMAPALARHLSPGGRAVLSGLLTRQEAMVLTAHRAQGLVLESRVRIGVWSTLVLRRPRRRL